MRVPKIKIYKYFRHIRFNNIRRYIYRVLFVSCAFLILLRWLPVPFSAYMLQQKIAHLWQGDFNYSLNYQWVSLDKIAWQMQLAVIAAEDQHFPQHFGFDFSAIQKALLHNQKGKSIRGASTISQQTTKNMFLWHGQSWLRKGLEVPATLSLELFWSKSRILEVYLNIAEFGDGIFGVEAASQYYFHKSAKNLNEQEAALLAAALPNPLIYKVKQPSRRLKLRQAWILNQMRLLGKSYLSKLE